MKPHLSVSGRGSVRPSGGTLPTYGVTQLGGCKQTQVKGQVSVFAHGRSFYFIGEINKKTKKKKKKNQEATDESPIPVFGDPDPVRDR
jgi:hypothetical protein